jgi:hypothetical protein
MLDLNKIEDEIVHWEHIVPKSKEIPKPRYAHTAVVLGDSMYVLGGYSAQYLDDFWEFNFITSTWRRYY